MNTLSIPMVAMAGISLYVGFYHLLIFFRRPQNREDLMFALLCCAYTFYAVFCAGLYNATSVIEGMQWQRAQFIALAVFVPAFLWFVSDYTHQKPGAAIYSLSAFYLLAIVVQLVDRSDLTFLVDQPSIKYVTLPYIQPITYYEATLGPFSTFQGLLGIVASTYILRVSIRYFRRGYQREAIPLIVAIVLMYAAGLHDTLVSNGVYHSIYLIEYSYLAVILLMANSLSNTVVEAALAKEKLRKSEERFRSLVETTSDWVWEVDANGVYTYASPKIQDLLGYQPEEVIGRTPFDLMPPEEAERITSIFQNVIRQKMPLEGLENIARCKDGHLITLETSGVPFLDDYGRLLGYRGIDRDITERKRVEAEIRSERQRLQTILETTRIPTLISRFHDGKVLYANEALAQISQVDLTKLVHFETSNFYANPGDQQTVREALEEFGHINEFEVQFRRTDGSLYWALLSSRIFDYEGESCVLSTYIDITGRKHAEQALQAKTEELDRYFTSSLDLLCIADTDGYFHRLNPEWETTLGYTLAELEGRQFLELVHPDDIEATRAAIAQLSNQQQILNFENRYRCKDGSYRWIEWRSYPTGKMIYAVARNITKRKQIAEALQQANLVVENSPVVLFRWKAAEGWPVVMVSQNVIQFGYTPEELLSESIPFAMLVHPEDRDKVIREVQEYSSSGVERFQQEYRLVTKSGESRWINDHTMIERNNNGQTTFYQGIIIDVTERKRAAEALSEQSHFIASLLRAMPVAVFYKDKEGRYLGCNDTFAKIMGVTTEEIRGKTVHELWPSELADKYHNMDMDLMRRKEHQEYEYQVQARDGKLHPVIFAKDVYLDQNGEVTGMVGAFLDITERKQVEEALHESEQKFRLFIEQSSDGLVFTDEQGIILVWNQAQESMTGIARQESLGKPLWEVQSDLTAAQVRKARVPKEALKQKILQALEFGQADFLYRPVEVELSHCDGTKVVIQQMTFAIKTNKGFRLGAIIRDITQLKQAEQELRASEERYRRLVEVSPIAMWTHKDGIVTYVNPAGLQVLGATHPGQVLGRLVLDFIHPDYHAIVKARVAQMTEDEKIAPLREEKYLRLDGSAVDVEVIATPLATSEGTLIQAFFQDITKRKQAEHLLSESERRFRGMAETMPDGVTILEENQVVFINDRLPEILGYSKEELAHMSGFDFASPEELEHLRSLAQQVPETGKTLDQIAFWCIRKDGERRFIRNRYAMLYDDNQNVVGRIILTSDETGRKLNEAEREALIKELEAKNAELERFTYTVSHDLKAPLITIRGFLGYVERDALSGDMQRLKGDLQRIVAATDKMQRLLSELLELSRIGRLMNPPENVPLESLVQEVIKLMQGRIQEKNIDIKIQNHLPVVFGDPQRLLEVVQNLLDNAVKFTDEQTKPVVEIGTQGEENGMPVFYVKDNGIGIAPEHHERIFGLFNKLNPNVEGTGVGLAIVKRVIEVHGGRIWVESEQGKGATFYFTLQKGT